jgi:hypothetical protein
MDDIIEPKEEKKPGPEFTDINGTQELPVYWADLQAATLRIFTKMMPIIEIRNAAPTRQNWTCQLWRNDLGDFGTLEIRELDPKWARVTFSGLHFYLDEKGILLDLNNPKREAKRNIMRTIINKYFVMLRLEGVLTNEGYDLMTGSNGEWQIWKHLPESKEVLQVLMYLAYGKTMQEIDLILGKSPGYASNNLTILRKKYKDKVDFPDGRKKKRD